MKKLPLFILLSTAQLSIAAPSPYCGFYVKGGIGGTIPQFESTQTITTSIPGIVTYSQPQSHDFSTMAFVGSLGGGYTFQVNKFFLISAEFDASFTNASISHSNALTATIDGETLTVSSDIEATLKNDFALLFKPGMVMLGQTQFYALIGPRWGNFETSTDTSIDFDSTYSGSGSQSESAYEVGLTVGLGVERLIADGFGVGLEYSYTSYGEIPSVHNSFATSGSGTVSDNLSIESSVNTLMATLFYHFR